MFNLEEFEQDQEIYPLVEKLNKLLDKNKTEKVEKVIKKLEELLEKQEHAISTSYILSVLAEHDFKLITESVFNVLENYINSDDPKLKVNTLIILGFAMLSNKDYINKYLPKFVKNLGDENKDVRDNIYYFLQEVGKKQPRLMCTYKGELINALSGEENKDNIITLMSFLEKCTDFDFKNLFDLREVLKSLITRYFSKEHSKIYLKLLPLFTFVFPSLKDLDIEQFGLKELLTTIQNIFLMKKYNFTEISKETGEDLKEFVKRKKLRNKKDNKIYFYIKEQKNVYFYELEKEKLMELFGKEEKLQKRKILKVFSPIIKGEPELRLFLNTLIMLRHIRGYYSKLGYFYSYNYVKSDLLEGFHSKGMVNLKKFDYLPPDFISGIIRDISNSTKQVFLIGKNNAAYYSLKNIQQQINTSYN